VKKKFAFFALCLFAAVAPCRATYHTNTITTPGGVFGYSVDGSPATNPTVQLVAGVTNILVISTVNFHPVLINTSPVTNFSAFYTNASPQNVFDQPISVRTATGSFPTNLYYICTFHGFFGVLHFSAPSGSAPPPNTILQIRVGTNVVMTSTGTNTTWTLIPEYSSNLLKSAWSPVPGFTNVFANGTNTTTFNRLDPICGPNVFLRLKQQQN
jgi:hypothetical protein